MIESPVFSGLEGPPSVLAMARREIKHAFGPELIALWFRFLEEDRK